MLKIVAVVALWKCAIHAAVSWVAMAALNSAGVRLLSELCGRTSL